jgi:hypothetical protein
VMYDQDKVLLFFSSVPTRTGPPGHFPRGNTLEELSAGDEQT